MQTIFSLITGNFGGSVSVIRISGAKTVECLKSLGFKGNITHQKTSLQKIVKNGEVIDEALVTFFKSPHSFTGEDVAEISIHASPFIIKKLFKILLEIKDVRFAEAGEFSKRAFLNGKMDLVQAEAIPDLITAETEAQHKQAIKQLQGELGKIYEDWRFRLIQTAAHLEAFIDFPEDDLPQDIIDKVESDVKNLSNEIKSHLSDNKIGQKIKDGLSLAIIGSPNVGKSSLINFLAKSEVAIVSEIAGTTRDIVETHLSIAGVAVKIADTAGLRATNDLIEKEGIRRALEKAKNADLKIFMLDANNPVIDEENKKLIDENTIILVNKIDLCEKIPQNIIELKPLLISLTGKINVSNLLAKLEEKIKEILPKTELAVITQERYRTALEGSIQYLEEFSLTKNIELAAEDLRMATREIGKITGKVDIENILDVIFSSFCIGK
ncbi:MAG: tRNA uridine-5-carboxymethylaminomethyl(34) synthesis GTPase MnmE [Rickettsiales bacterium]|nr:tRNA uridine-5-carboxymethylaminomethyl(34) synthesis GTPase MnmE [Rickettsiales bacterium]